ncbi:conserved hypothetical protein [Neospora caninum Liverpool]|uniref:Uncharacterized protein n=1 Tax=Neospora caninum (strain Liverpool) TaxID=572307 RepID=F0VAA9_NEOCL|nr:conserved hypothetical protein [Neospora caninum Liverpool]CBZ50598.1 conserved hypothetical protein [Neospora caninum Liverpool]CEL65211.1 TPA: hypothetical protein BN1204_010670 [Neospora caninum Liverpool]|eukprot:XP_003880631.1 conserved hypothetical protein [Neospora caninum Liverpool]
MPAKPPKAAGTMSKAKGKKKKTQGQKGNLPPRPDLRSYPKHQGPLPKPGWYTRCSVDDQIDACARKLRDFSLLTRPNGLPPRILLEASGSPRLALRSSSSRSDAVPLQRQAATSSSPGSPFGRPKTAISPQDPSNRYRLERPTLSDRAPKAVLAARTPAAAIRIPRSVEAAAIKMETSAMQTKTGGSLPCDSQTQATDAQWANAVTVDDVKALNIAGDPRYLEMQEFVSRCAERVSQAGGGGPGLEPTPDGFSAVPPTRRFRLEARWIPKQPSANDGNRCDGYSPKASELLPVVEPPVWGNPPSSLSRGGGSGTSCRRRTAFWNPKSYQHTGSTPRTAVAEPYTQAFFAELENRLREVLSCRNTKFRLSQLDSVYAWFQRQRPRSAATASSGAGPPRDCGGTDNRPNWTVTDALSTDPSDLPPAYPPPELPSPSDAFDASALASCRGSAFYDPQRPRRGSNGGFASRNNSTDNLDTAGNFRLPLAQDRLLGRQRESKRSSASGSICNSRRSSVLPASKGNRRSLEDAVSVAENPDVEACGSKASRDLTDEGRVHQDRRHAGSISAEEPSFLDFLQSHAPLVSPQDYLLELETRDLLPQGNPEDFISARRALMLDQLSSPVGVFTSRKEKATTSAPGREYAADRASVAAPDRSGATETEARTMTQTWAASCHRKYRGDLQQRYIQDLRKIRPPWGMKNIHVNSPSATGEGKVSLSNSPARWPRNHVERPGRLPRQTFAGKMSDLANPKRR